MSPYILAPLLAWLLAQILKYFIRSLHDKNLKSYNLLYTSGGMPSAHTAMVIALAATIGVREGLGSSLFAVSAALALITAYDSMHVRRATGEHGAALTELLKTSGSKTVLHQATGHRPLEVLGGAVLGAVVAAAVLSLN
ncbi:MAG: divergent PAP2 family protein [Candidatus Chaera renei]|uniref:Divergent PAP2 family protein n=1 Tax=Candidatus Chaera renei TaxID=2506947 RepID=A0A4Q0AII7_9BACT|nr:MAG: divergent PAP2 family protein [Candidatus Chaera renei]